MGSFLNFVFEGSKDTFNGSPRYCYGGPLYNYAISKHYTENLELCESKNNFLFFEVNRAELQLKNIVKKYKDWCITNNVNIILANIADPTEEESYTKVRSLIDKSGLGEYIHWIDSNITLKKYPKTYAFDYFIEELTKHKDKEGELFGYGSKNDLGYVSQKIEERELDTFRNKKFLSFNRIISPKYHRSKLLFDSLKFNLHKDSYFSFLQNEIYEGWDFFDYFVENLEYKKQFVDECTDKLPIILDTKEYDGSYAEFRTHNTFKKELFLDSCINIVTETSFQFNELFLSEKILKPIVMYQPFIVLSGVGYLKHLKELGFRTFDYYWDESYDDIEDFEKRYNKILLLILELNNKPIDELNNLYKNLKNICIYNRNHLIKMKNNSWFDIFSSINGEFKKITTKENQKDLI